MKKTGFPKSDLYFLGKRSSNGTGEYFCDFSKNGAGEVCGDEMADKTVTIITQRLEKVNVFGRRKLYGYTQSKTIDFHTDKYGMGRAA